jgi:uncharacterized damage-inducible protein DinB
MRPPTDLGASLLAAWRTCSRVTSDLIENLPPELWTAEVPGIPRKTVRAIAAHLHNARCGWIKTLGREHGIKMPEHVDRSRATLRQVTAALKRSSAGMEALFKLGLTKGELPPSKGYVWRNLSLDLGHVVTYFVAHEAHHRGQIVMIARQTGHRVPAEAINGLWWWKMQKK